MTTRDGFTRLIDTWLAEEGAPTAPDYLDLVLRPDVGDPAAAGLAQPREVAARGRRPSTRAPTRFHRSLRYAPAGRASHRPRAHRLSRCTRDRSATVCRRHFGPAANGRHLLRRRRRNRGDQPRRHRAADDRRRRARRIGAVREPRTAPGIAFVAPIRRTSPATAYWSPTRSASDPHAISGDLRLDIDPTFNPTWSPDGRQLAFARIPRRLLTSCSLRNADGSGRSGGRTTATSTRARTPEWSTTGDWIAFMAIAGLTSPVHRRDQAGRHRRASRCRPRRAPAMAFVDGSSGRPTARIASLYGDRRPHAPTGRGRRDGRDGRRHRRRDDRLGRRRRG